MRFLLTLLFPIAILAARNSSISLPGTTTSPAFSSPGSVEGTTSHYAKVGGHVYHYLRGIPSSKNLTATTTKGTILLLHGYPDTSYGWRNQIPYLTSLGYQVIAPDMLGYANTDSPKELANWAKKKLSADMAELMDLLVPGQQVIVGGHDWGAVLAYKMAIWYPHLVKAMLTISAPYWPPVFGLSAQPFVDIPELSRNERGSYRALRYQLQWRDFAWERNFGRDETVLGWLLNAMYGGVTPNGTSAFSLPDGLDLSLLPSLAPTTLLGASDLDFYVKEFAKQGLRGPGNWYRTLRMDWEDELEIAKKLEGKRIFGMKSLFVGSSLDAVFTPETWPGARQYFEEGKLRIEGVEAGHWAMWEKPEEVNGVVGRWLREEIEVS